MKKFAVILCGSGSMDGSEIHEAVMSLLAIDEAGCKYTIFAPNDNQFHVVNHITSQPVEQTRNMMEEAGRIGRGEVQELSKFNVDDFDALILPGGFGAAKNLFTYAFDGINATVRPDIEKIIIDTHKAKKPIGALCIAPVLVSKVLKKVTVTVGQDEQTIKDVIHFGSKHQETSQAEVCSDLENLIFSTPCYMLPATIKDIALSADQLILEILKHI